MQQRDEPADQPPPPYTDQPDQFGAPRTRSGVQPVYGQQVPQYGQQVPQYGQQQQQPYPGPQYQQPYQAPNPQPPKKKAGKVLGFGCLGVVALVIIIVIAAAVTGTKSNSTVSTTAAGTHAAGATTAAAAAAAPAAPTKPAGLGDTIDLTGYEGDHIAVTVEKVDLKAAATDGFSTPPAGDSYYAAQVQIKNIGSSAYSDAPSNCLVAKDSSGQTFQTDIVESISSGPLMATTVNLAAGDSSLGWVVFDVPTGDTVTQVQFTVDSGMGDQTGQWSIS
jgi:Domain of unknown function (DUF4352)